MVCKLCPLCILVCWWAMLSDRPQGPESRHNTVAVRPRYSTITFRDLCSKSKSHGQSVPRCRGSHMDSQWPYYQGSHMASQWPFYQGSVCLKIYVPQGYAAKTITVPFFHNVMCPTIASHFWELEGVISWHVSCCCQCSILVEVFFGFLRQHL